MNGMSEEHAAKMQEMQSMMSQMSEIMTSMQVMMDEMAGDGEEMGEEEKKAEYFSKSPSEREKIDAEQVMNPKKKMKMEIE